MNEALINDKLSKLSTDKLILFCNLNCEKLIPGYHVFSQIADWGDFKFFTAVIEKVYKYLILPDETLFLQDWCSGLAANFPDLDNFNTSSASYAFDACCAFNELISFLIEGDKAHVYRNSQACINTVDMFIQQKENIDYVKFEDIPNLEKMISEDEYMIKEINRQLKLLTLIENIPAINNEAITLLKEANNNFGHIINYQILFKS